MANAEHVAILQQGVEAWNTWRKEQRSAWRYEPTSIKPDLCHTEFPNIDLTGIDFSETTLSRSSFSAATFHEADFTGADLLETTFTQANLVRANLRQANLTRATFVNASLSEANLTGTNLTGANLTGANLFRATSIGAIFVEACLMGSSLISADLTESNLTGADLSEARLLQTNFLGTHLQGTTIRRASIGSTIFAQVDLRTVQGLDTVKHRLPSVIGIDTLYRSQGQIPEVFLRGCGVPDSMIEYARALVAAERPIDYYSVFISYSSQDEALAQRLHADLQSKGVRCWFAPHDLEIGEVITRGIDEAIRISDKQLIILSEAAVQSRWVEFEVNQALYCEVEQGRTMLFPIRLDDAVLHTPSGWAAQLRSRHIGDFRGWKDHDHYQEAFTRLLRDLKANG